MLKEEIDQLIGYNPDLEPDQQMPTVEYATRFLLVSAMDYHRAGKEIPEHFRCFSSQAGLAAAAARLLVALHGEENPTDVAWEVVESIDDGLDLHVWAGRELARRGIVMPEESL